MLRRHGPKQETSWDLRGKQKQDWFNTCDNVASQAPLLCCYVLAFGGLKRDKKLKEVLDYFTNEMKECDDPRSVIGNSVIRMKILVDCMRGFARHYDSAPANKKNILCQSFYKFLDMILEFPDHAPALVQHGLLSALITSLRNWSDHSCSEKSHHEMLHLRATKFIITHGRCVTSAPFHSYLEILLSRKSFLYQNWESARVKFKEWISDPLESIPVSQKGLCTICVLLGKKKILFFFQALSLSLDAIPPETSDPDEVKQNLFPSLYARVRGKGVVTVFPVPPSSDPITLLRQKAKMRDDEFLISYKNGETDGTNVDDNKFFVDACQQDWVFEIKSRTNLFISKKSLPPIFLQKKNTQSRSCSDEDEKMGDPNCREKRGRKRKAIGSNDLKRPVKKVIVEVMEDLDYKIKCLEMRRCAANRNVFELWGFFVKNQKKEWLRLKDVCRPEVIRQAQCSWKEKRGCLEGLGTAKYFLHKCGDYAEERSGLHDCDLGDDCTKVKFGWCFSKNVGQKRIVTQLYRQCIMCGWKGKDGQTMQRHVRACWSRWFSPLEIVTGPVALRLPGPH